MQRIAKEAARLKAQKKMEHREWLRKIQEGVADSDESDSMNSARGQANGLGLQQAIRQNERESRIKRRHQRLIQDRRNAKNALEQMIAE